MSKSCEIAGMTFEKAFAIAVMAISYLVDRIDNVRNRLPDDFAPTENGFGFVSKRFRESTANRKAIGSEVLIFA
jgi:hypothetical protein